jgi:hypothetical protein
VVSEYHALHPPVVLAYHLLVCTIAKVPADLDCV